MPFKSKAQMKKFFAMEKRGEIPPGTAKRWAEETPKVEYHFRRGNHYEL